MKHLQSLRLELQAAGADKAEAADLARLAAQLRQLGPQIAMAPKPRALWLRLLPRVATLTAALVIGMGLVAFSQASLPGSFLYPLKRASENAAVAVAPSYRAVVMMRRADEVKQLVAGHANSKTVLATLADYKADAAAYKTHNYAAFSYCKSSLREAQAAATPTEQRMITSTLNSLVSLD